MKELLLALFFALFGISAYVAQEFFQISDLITGVMSGVAVVSIIIGYGILASVKHDSMRLGAENAQEFSEQFKKYKDEEK